MCAVAGRLASLSPSGLVLAVCFVALFFGGLCVCVFRFVCHALQRWLFLLGTMATRPPDGFAGVHVPEVVAPQVKRRERRALAHAPRQMRRARRRDPAVREMEAGEGAGGSGGSMAVAEGVSCCLHVGGKEWWGMCVAPWQERSQPPNTHAPHLADLCTFPSTPTCSPCTTPPLPLPCCPPPCVRDVRCPFQFTATGVLLSPIQGSGGEGGTPSSLVPPQLPVYPPSALTLAANAAYSPKLAALRTAGPSTLPVVLATGRLCSLRYFV